MEIAIVFLFGMLAGVWAGALAFQLGRLRSRRRRLWQEGWNAAEAHFPPPWKIERQSWEAGWEAAMRETSLPSFHRSPGPRPKRGPS